MKRLLNSPGFLVVYSGALTALFALILLSQEATIRKTSFEEIDVQRINVVEPDGTIRLVLSNKALFPGSSRGSLPSTSRPIHASAWGKATMDRFPCGLTTERAASA